MQNRRRSRQFLEVINSTSPLKALENNTFEVGVRNIDLVMNRKATIAGRTKRTMVGLDVYHDLSKGDVERWTEFVVLLSKKGNFPNSKQWNLTLRQRTKDSNRLNSI